VLGKRVRRGIFAVLLLGLGGAVWAALGWPPPHWILLHGLPPTGGPTGRTRKVEGVEFVEIEGGYYRKGSHHRCEEGDLLGRLSSLVGLEAGTPPRHAGREHGECPTEWVRVPGPIWVAETEVTNGQLRRFGRGFPDDRPDHPARVEVRPFVTRYLDWLSDRGGASVRLPTEEEWEYLARAGSEGEYCYGDDPAKLDEHARFGNWSRGTWPVRSRRPNAWGLYDVHGSLWELCAGRIEMDGVPESFPLRGGSFASPRGSCRCASRTVVGGHSPWVTVGIRPVAAFEDDGGER